MNNHFTSVLRVEKPEKEAEEKLGVSTQESTVFLQPHPLSPSQLTYQFDRIYSGAEGSSELYKTSVKEVVEGTLVGYHGAVILFGVKGSGLSKLLLNSSSGLVQKAALHICKCLQKSKESNSQHATNLVVLCSYVIVVDEDAYDLLVENPSGVDADPRTKSSVRIENGGVVGATTHQVKSAAKVQSLLKRGAENEVNILARYGRVPEQGLHHTVLSLSVEYAQFGTINAPVSGNLNFVQVGAAEPLASSESYQTQSGQFAPSVASIFGFASAVNTISAEDFLRGGRPQCAADILESCTLNRLLKEALGGNCKTLLVALVPSSYRTDQRSEVNEVLSLSSRARAIQNNPNKRIFAEKALMTAYMKELHKKYGGLQETAPDVVSANEQRPSEQKVEMAASALAAAAAECGSDEEEVEEDDGDRLRHSASDTAPPVKVTGKKKSRPSTMSRPIDPFGGSGNTTERSTFTLSQGDTDGTIDILVSTLQDPDHGVPRARDAALKDLKLKREVGAVFSAPDLVKWMMMNIAGVEDEQEAEKLCQMLVDKDVVFHTEGSSLFANAESLLYGVKPAKPTTKTLSREEVKALLMAGSKAEKQSVTNVTLPNGEVKESQKRHDKKHSRKHSSRHRNGNGADALERGQESTGVNALERGQESTGVNALETGQDGTGVEDVGQDVNDLQRGHHTREQDVSEANDGREQGHKKTHRRHHKDTSAPDRGHNDTGAHITGQDDSCVHEVDQNETYAADQYVYNEFPNTEITQNVVLQSHTEHGELLVDGMLEGVQGNLPENGTMQHNHTLEDPNMNATTYSEEWMDDNVTGGEDGPSTEEVNAPSVKRIEKLPTVFTLENSVDYPHPLHMAAAIGKAPGVLSNLVMMFGVDTLDEYKRTPLMFAALGNKRASCSTLIECGADVNHRDSSGLTPLHIACYHGNRDSLGVLINKGAVPGLTDRQGHTAVHWSTVPAHPGCLQLVLRYSSPALINQPDKKGLTPLHWAIHYDHLDHVKLLLRHATLLKRDSTGRTLLTYAIEREAVGSVTLLLQHCPALIALDDVNKSTPLHHASVKESPVYLNMLFEVADKAAVVIDINKQDKCKQTPLHCAALCNHPRSIKILLERGALKDITDANGKTAVDIAREGDGEYAIKVLEGVPVDLPRANSSDDSKVCIIL